MVPVGLSTRSAAADQCHFSEAQHEELGQLLGAVIFSPIPLPRKVLQTSYCTHLLLKDITQTGLGMGIGMNGTAQLNLKNWDQLL